MPSVVASLSISDSLQEGFNAFFAFIPNLIGFLVILLVGWLLARIVRTLVTKGLEAAGLDRALHESDAGAYVEKVSPGARPSKLIGAIAFWFIFLFVLTAALSALKIPAVTAFMNEVLSYLPNVIAAVLIFVIAAALAGAIGGIVAKLLGDTPTGKVAATAVPALIMVIAVFMILNQLRIAPAIVSITYTALLGSIALGAALAFGLGGREVAARMLEDAYRKAASSAGRSKTTSPSPSSAPKREPRRPSGAPTSAVRPNPASSPSEAPSEPLPTASQGAGGRTGLTRPRRKQ